MKDDAFLRLVTCFGPRNLSKIARRLHVSSDTAARAYTRLTEEGLSPRPDIRIEKLGLQRVITLAKPGESGKSEQLDSYFRAMGDYAFLEHAQKLDPYNLYLLQFTLPPEFIHKVNDLLRGLSETGVLHAQTLTPLGWFRQHPLRGPWNPPPSEPITTGPIAYVPENAAISPTKFDYKDLLLIASLQAKPNGGMPELLQMISRWAEGGYEEIKQHLSSSVSDWYYRLQKVSRLVAGYPVHLSRGEPGVTRRKRHFWASFTIWWKNLSVEAMKKAIMACSAIPYLRFDEASWQTGFYLSTTVAPGHLIPGYISFLSQTAPPGMRVSMPSKFKNYSIPFPAYHQEAGQWAWMSEKLEALLPTAHSA